MRHLVATELDSVDRLPVGSGALDFHAIGRGDLDSGFLGAGVEYRHRLTKRASIFGLGEVGYEYGNSSGLAWRAIAGYRLKF